MEELQTAINDFYSGQCKDIHQTVHLIRHSYAKLLRQGNDISFLNEKTQLSSFRTRRGQLWGIFLSLGEFDCPDEQKLYSNVKQKDFKEIVENQQREIDRIKKDQGFGQIEIEEYASWLTLFSGLIFNITSAKRVFHQETYAFGLFFLRNLDLVTSYQAYFHLISPIKHAFLLETTNRISQLCDMCKEIIQNCDSDLYQIMRNIDNFTTTYAPISSLFSQLRPMESVEILWDFLFVYGIEFCVYLEAAWLVLKRQTILDNHRAQNIAQDHQFSHTPRDLILKAIELYQTLNEQKRKDIGRKIHLAIYS